MKHLSLIILISSITFLSSCTRLIETEERTKEICNTFTIDQNGELEYQSKGMSLFTDRSSIQFMHWKDKNVRFESNNKEYIFTQTVKKFNKAEYHPVLGDSKVATLSFDTQGIDTGINIELLQYYYCLKNKMEIDGYINDEQFGFYKEGYTRYKSTGDTDVKKERNYQNEYLKGYSHNIKEYNKDKKSPTSRRYRGGRFALYLYPKSAKNLEYVVWDPELGIVEFKLFSNQAPFYRIFDNPTGN